MKKALLRHILTPAIITILMLSCSGNSRYRALLDRADSLMAEHPDSAYALLASIDSADMSQQRKAVRMRYELQRAEAQNKLYTPFTTDSVLRRVVGYYDRHGSANQRLKARYILGCAYRDLHEAPIALLTWEEAIVAADTTAADCDFATLSRVYGQMAAIYMRQHLPEKQLEALMAFSKCALLNGDTLNYLRGLLQCNSAYYTLGDTAAIFTNSEEIHKQYLSLGMIQEAAKVYPTPIHVAVENGQFDRGRTMMDEYERSSGLFDEYGNIKEPSRVQYYYYKGLYYLGVQQTDSAEIQFRKLLPDSLHIIDACRGLLNLYQAKHNADSVYKYGRYYEEALSRHAETLNGEAVIQAEALYDYQRNERIARIQRQKLNNIYWMCAIAGLLFTAISGFTYYRYRIRKRLKEQEISILIKSVNQSENEKSQLEEDLVILSENLKASEDSRRLLTKKQAELKSVTAKLKEYEIRTKQEQASTMAGVLMDTEILKVFRTISAPRHQHEGSHLNIIPARIPSDEEWEILFATVRQYLPSFFAFVESALSRHTQEFKVALLTRLDFSNKELAALLDTSTSRISTVKEIINKKLFGKKGTKSLIFNLKHFDGLTT